MGENPTKSKEVCSAGGDQSGGVPRGGTRGLCLRSLGVGHGGRGAGEKAVVMEKAGEKWPRVVPLSTAGLNPMSTGLAGNRRDEGLAQSASSQHFRRDPTCQTCSKQVVDISQPIPPPCRVGAVAASLWRGHPGRGQIARTQSQQGACGQSSSGSGGRSWVSMWGEREGRGLGQTAEHEPVWGALDLGPPRAPGEGLGPGVPSPETLRESDSQGKSQGFRMLTVDSLFPKTQEG